MAADRSHTRDAVGQVVRVNDLVGGVRLGDHPTTVAGQVTKIGQRQVKLRVVLVTDTGDHARRSSRYVNRPSVGDEVWIYTERAFKVDAIFTEEQEEHSDE